MLFERYQGEDLYDSDGEILPMPLPTRWAQVHKQVQDFDRLHHLSLWCKDTWDNDWLYDRRPGLGGFCR